MASFDLHEESIYPGWMRACTKPSRFLNKYDIKKPMLSTDALSSIRKKGMEKNNTTNRGAMHETRHQRLHRFASVYYSTSESVYIYIYTSRLISRRKLEKSLFSKIICLNGKDSDTVFFPFRVFRVIREHAGYNHGSFEISRDKFSRIGRNDKVRKGARNIHSVRYAVMEAVCR